MRLVFAGTPEVAVPSLDALLASAHEVVAVLTRPDAPAGRGRRLRPSRRWRQRAEEAGIEVLRPPRPRDPGVPGAAAASSRRTAARSSPTARWCPPAALDDPAARLGQPALLAAARLARRRPGAARGPARRRGHRRQRVPARGGPGHRPGLRRHHRAVRPARHHRRPARAARRRRRRAAASRPSTRIEGGERRRRAAAGRRRVASRPKLTVEDARVDWTTPAFHVDRRIRACTPAPGAWTTWRGERLKLGPVEPGRRQPGPRARRGAGRPARGAGRHRRRAGGPARRGAPGRQAPDGGRRLGPRRARPRRRGARHVTGAPPLHARPAAPVAVAAGSPPPRRDRPQPDAARRAAFDLLRAVDERDAYANLVLPGAAARARPGRARRRVRHRARLRHAARPRARTTRSSPPASTGRWGQVDPPVLDVLRLGAHQLLAHAGAAARRGRRDRRPGPGGGRRGRRVASSTRCCARSARSDLDALAGRRSRRRSTTTRSGTSRSSHTHPRWIVSALRDALGGDLGRDRGALLAADNVPRRRCTLVARPGRADAWPSCWRRAPGRARWSPYAAVLPGGDPGALAAVREGRAGVQDEGSQLVALALAGAPRSTGRGPSAGSTCAPARAARRRCSARSRGERGAALLAVEVAPHRARLVAPRSRAPTRRWSSPTGGRRPGADGSLRPGAASTRRAPAWARCAGGRRRAGGGSRRTSPPLTALQRELLGAALRRGPAGRRGRLRHLLAAPGRDARRGRRRAAARRPRRRAASTPGRCCPACPTLGAGPGRAALAAPARHRRDVPRAAAPGLSGPSRP